MQELLSLASIQTIGFQSLKLIYFFVDINEKNYYLLYLDEEQRPVVHHLDLIVSYLLL
jgi:hypothetical protein